MLSLNISLVPRIDDVVWVDRSICPNYPPQVRRVIHPDLESHGPDKFETSEIILWLHEGQRVGVVNGGTIYRFILENQILRSCLGLRDLEEIQKKGLHHFRRHFRGKAVFGWKSIVLFEDGYLYVPFLIEDLGTVALYWYWLNGGWDAVGPALRFP